MHLYTLGCLFFLSAVFSLPVEDAKFSSDLEDPAAAKVVKLFRNKRSPVPEPTHHHSKLHAHVHIHGHVSEPAYYVKPVPVVQPVYVKPVPVVQPVAVQPVAVQPVSAGCNVCGGGGGGGLASSHSQASSQASSGSFSAGLNSPFGSLGFSSSSAQSSAQAGSAGYGK